MLTTGSTRLAVSRGQQTWYHSTWYTEMLSRPGSPRPRPDQDQTGRDQDQDQDLKKVVLIGLETKTRSRDMYAMLLYKSSKS